MTVSAMTREYWLETVLSWAEDRLAPPQFDECKRALTQSDTDLRNALIRLVNAADGQKPIGDLDQYKRLVAERDAAVAQARLALNA